MSTYKITGRRVELVYILYGVVILTSKSVRECEKLQHFGELY